MSTFMAVLQDLWDFLINDLWVAEVEDNISEPAATNKKHLLLPQPAPVSTLVREPQPAGVGLMGESAYVQADRAKLWQRPVVSEDGAVLSLSYGAKVEVLRYEGRFAWVKTAMAEGWILKDSLVKDSTIIFPVFNNGEIYNSNHPDTKKLRRLSVDEFSAGELFLPLQAVEFVTYKLSNARHYINWSSERPRLAGNWHNILRGRSGVEMSIAPKTGAVIEYLKPDGTGWVGYTKSVHVDDSIVIEGVGRLIEGEYKEEVVDKDVWHEWRPVWIKVL